MSRILFLSGAYAKAVIQNCWLALLLKEQGYIIKLKLFPWLIIVSTHVQGATAVFPMKTMPVSRMTIWR
jgi:hypothetical protein